MMQSLSCRCPFPDKGRLTQMIEVKSEDLHVGVRIFSKADAKFVGKYLTHSI